MQVQRRFRMHGAVEEVKRCVHGQQGVLQLVRLREMCIRDREEIERSIDKELFEELEHKIIGKPLIPKTRRTYRLPDGSALEVNHVDAGQPTAFWYAEVEYPTVEAANAWQPAAWGLADYLSDEVTGQPGQSMGAYWLQTRG